MTTRTKSELAKNVLLSIGVLDAISSPSAADSEYVIARYLDVMAELSEDEMAYWPEDAIPLIVFEPLTHLLALTVGPAFGTSSVADNSDANRRPILQRIRKHTGMKTAKMPVVTEDF